MKPISYFFRLLKSKPAKLAEHMTNMFAIQGVSRFFKSDLFNQMVNTFYHHADVAEKLEQARVWGYQRNLAMLEFAEKRPYTTLGIGLSAASVAASIPHSIHMLYQRSKVDEYDKRWMVQQEWEGNPAFQMWGNRTNHALMR